MRKIIICMVFVLIILSAFYFKNSIYVFNEEREKEIINKINLDKCISSNNLKLVKGISYKKNLETSPSALIMANILRSTSINIKCITDELKLDSYSSKNEIIQRVSSYITYKTVYTTDRKRNMNGTSFPSLFIKIKTGDCEDKAMFGLLLFDYFNLNVKILEKRIKKGEEGHIALKVDNIIFDVYDTEYKKVYDIIKEQEKMDISDYNNNFKEYSLDKLDKILQQKNLYNIKIRGEIYR